MSSAHVTAAIDAFTISSGEPPRPGTQAVFVAAGGLAILHGQHGTLLWAMDGARLLSGRATSVWQSARHPNSQLVTLRSDAGVDGAPPAECYLDRADAIRAQVLCCIETEKTAIFAKVLAPHTFRAWQAGDVTDEEAVAQGDPDDLLRVLAEVLR